MEEKAFEERARSLAVRHPAAMLADTAMACDKVSWALSVRAPKCACSARNSDRTEKAVRPQSIYITMHVQRLNRFHMFSGSTAEP